MQDGRQALVDAMRRVQGDRSMREFAAFLNVSHSMLIQIYNGYRNPGRKILGALIEHCPEMTEPVTLFLRSGVASASDDGHERD